MKVSKLRRWLIFVVFVGLINGLSGVTPFTWEFWTVVVPTIILAKWYWGTE